MATSVATRMVAGAHGGAARTSPYTNTTSPVIDHKSMFSSAPPLPYYNYPATGPPAAAAATAPAARTTTGTKPIVSTSAAATTATTANTSTTMRMSASRPPAVATTHSATAPRVIMHVKRGQTASANSTLVPSTASAATSGGVSSFGVAATATPSAAAAAAAAVRAAALVSRPASHVMTATGTTSVVATTARTATIAGAAPILSADMQRQKALIRQDQLNTRIMSDQLRNSSLTDQKDVGAAPAPTTRTTTGTATAAGMGDVPSLENDEPLAYDSAAFGDSDRTTDAFGDGAGVKKHDDDDTDPEEFFKKHPPVYHEEKPKRMIRRQLVAEFAQSLPIQAQLNRLPTGEFPQKAWKQALFGTPVYTLLEVSTSASVYSIVRIDVSSYHISWVVDKKQFAKVVHDPSVLAQVVPPPRTSGGREDIDIIKIVTSNKRGPMDAVQLVFHDDYFTGEDECNTSDDDDPNPEAGGSEDETGSEDEGEQTDDDQNPDDDDGGDAEADPDDPDSDAAARPRMAMQSAAVDVGDYDWKSSSVNVDTFSRALDATGLAASSATADVRGMPVVGLDRKSGHKAAVPFTTALSAPDSAFVPSFNSVVTAATPTTAPVSDFAVAAAPSTSFASVSASSFGGAAIPASSSSRAKTTTTAATTSTSQLAATTLKVSKVDTIAARPAPLLAAASPSVNPYQSPYYNAANNTMS